MSDVSVVSQEYKTASELSKVIDNALLILKKTREAEIDTPLPPGLTKPGGFSSEPEAASVKESSLQETDNAENIRKLQQVLEAIIFSLEPSTERRSDLKILAQVPANIIGRILEERRGDLEYYLDDLKQTSNKLILDPSKLTTDNLALIDHLAAIVDLQATTLFRRLMRR